MKQQSRSTNTKNNVYDIAQNIKKHQPKKQKEYIKCVVKRKKKNNKKTNIYIIESTKWKQNKRL